jgi:hypothetical protein
MRGLPSAPRVVFLVSLVLAGISTPFNIILVLYSWAFIARLFGNYFADNQHWATFTIATIVHTGAFALLALVICAALRRARARTQSVAVIVAAVVWSGATLGVLFLIGPVDL